MCNSVSAELSLVSEKFANLVGNEMGKISQGTVQADINTLSKVVKEVKNIPLIKGAHVFNLHAEKHF